MQRRAFILAGPLVLLSEAPRAGTFGPKSFGNDDALDWADDCVRAVGVAPVEIALEDAVSVFSWVYLQAPAGARAIAAAEVVAAAIDRNAMLLPAHLSVWIAKHPVQPVIALRPLALRAVKRVAKESRSELRSLWSEGGPKSYSQWEREVDELLRRLGTI